jgi:CheY-like chemotaxis protein
MNGVMGMAMLLEDTSLTNEQKEYTGTIRKCGEGLLTTVNEILANDILDFSKLDGEEKNLEYSNFDLRDCVQDVLEMFAAKTGKSGPELMYYIDKGVREQLVGDKKRLRQVLMNLLENAVKYTKQGEIIVNVHSSTHPTGHYPELHFEVKDTGIGIEEQQLKQLFKGIPGKESDNTGLGLVVCKKLVELMGGTIDVKSQYGKGSSFIFTLPLTPSMKASYNLTDPANLENKRILLVDDNIGHLTLLMKQMKSWKMIPASADSGQEALDTLAENANFDVMLIDMNMPDMNGVELAKSISYKYPAIPLILMNGGNDESYKQESSLFASVLAKPLRQYVLRDQLSAVFSRSAEGKDSNTNKLSEDFSKQYPLKILIAEDNMVNQKLAMKILGKLGYQPALANNGKEALEMVSSEQFDVILMDVQMPEMDGLEATRMMRTCLEIQPVIIAVTANVMMGDRDDCMQAGMDDYMSKPIELDELLNKLEKWAPVIKERKKV